MQMKLLVAFYIIGVPDKIYTLGSPAASYQTWPKQKRKVHLKCIRDRLKCDIGLHIDLHRGRFGQNTPFTAFIPGTPHVKYYPRPTIPVLGHLLCRRDHEVSPHQALAQFDVDIPVKLTSDRRSSAFPALGIADQQCGQKPTS